MDTSQIIETSMPATAFCCRTKNVSDCIFIGPGRDPQWVSVPLRYRCAASEQVVRRSPVSSIRKALCFCERTNTSEQVECCVDEASQVSAMEPRPSYSIAFRSR